MENMNVIAYILGMKSGALLTLALLSVAGVI